MGKSMKLELTEKKEGNFEYFYIRITKRESDDEIGTSVSMNVPTEDSLRSFIEACHYWEIIKGGFETVLIEGFPPHLVDEVVRETKRLSPRVSVLIDQSA